jgi:hypothetical protein
MISIHRAPAKKIKKSTQKNDFGKSQFKDQNQFRDKTQKYKFSRQIIARYSFFSILTIFRDRYVHAVIYHSTKLY